MKIKNKINFFFYEEGLNFFFYLNRNPVFSTKILKGKKIQGHTLWSGRNFF